MDRNTDHRLSDSENCDHSDRSEISVAALYKKSFAGFLLKLVAPLVDRLLGVRQLRNIYERDQLSGLDRFTLLERFMEKEHIQYAFDEKELSRIPNKGPVIIVANHPMGGLEGILLMLKLRLVRPDYKVFANIVDSFFVELKEFFIFTNPMIKGSAVNIESIRKSREWLAQGHGLLIFPAGRVGLYQPEKGYVTDEPWDEIALGLGRMTGADFVPIFIEGECSKLFSFLSRYIYPMKLLFLAWEFVISFKNPVVFHIGHAIPSSRLAAFNRKQANDWLRMRTYLLSPLTNVSSGLSESEIRSIRRQAVIDTVHQRMGKQKERKSRKHKRERGILHPEVEDYIIRYGLDDQEIEELSNV